MDDARKLADLDEVPADSTLLVTLREGFDEREALLIRLDNGGAPAVSCWLNYCQHWTDVRLDKGSGARVTNGEIWCQKHGATFAADDGECTHGPCEGAFLEPVAVEVHDGAVYLTDDDYEFDHLGPGEDIDLSTGAPGGRIDFTGS